MKNKIEILIVDDDDDFIEELEDIIKKGFFSKGDNFRFTKEVDPVIALQSIQNGTNSPDIILVDIEMPEMNGFEFISQSGYSKFEPSGPYIIVISADDSYDRYVKSTNMKLEYLVKGSDVEDNLCLKIEEYLHKCTLSVSEIGFKGRYQMNQIWCIEASQDYSTLYFKDGSHKLVTKSLSELTKENNLLCRGFIMTHRSYIVNKFLVQGYKPDKKCFCMTNENVPLLEVPISKSRKTTLPVLELIDILAGK